jgi:hypothetical protein
MTGTVPASSGVAARVWLDLSSEPLEPADRSHPLQRDPVTGTVPAASGVAARVWLDLSSEPLEPVDQSHSLQSNG